MANNPTEYVLNVQPAVMNPSTVGQVGVIDTEDGPVTVIFMEEGANTPVVSMLNQSASNPLQALLNNPKVEISIIEGDSSQVVTPTADNSHGNDINLQTPNVSISVNNLDQVKPNSNHAADINLQTPNISVDNLDQGKPNSSRVGDHELMLKSQPFNPVVTFVDIPTTNQEGDHETLQKSPSFNPVVKFVDKPSSATVKTNTISVSQTSTLDSGLVSIEVPSYTDVTHDKHLIKNKSGNNVSSKTPAIAYKCTLCSSKFESVSLLLKHRSQSHRVQEKVTDLASKIPVPQGRVSNDIMNMPKEDKTKKTSIQKNTYCNVCKRWFINASALDKHNIKIHRSMKTQQILLHQKMNRIKGFKVLYLHKLSTSEKQKLCFVKNKYYNVNYFVNESKLIESAGRPSINSLNKLYDNNGRGKFYKCLYCHQCYKDYDQIKHHASIHRTVCFECGKKTKDFARLRSHRLNVHGSKQDGTHQCPHCTKTLSSRQDLLSHMKSHFGPWICERVNCEASFSERADLVLHRQGHGHPWPEQGMARFDGTVSDGKGLTLDTINNFIEVSGFFTETAVGRVSPIAKCKICRQQFYNTSITRKHIKMTHMKDGSEKFQCQLCDFSTHFGYVFNRHKKIHRIPSVCSVCGKSFDTEKKLTKHKMLHKQQDIYQCFYCSKQFQSKQKCVNHINDVHASKIQPEAKPDVSTITNRTGNTGSEIPSGHQLDFSAEERMAGVSLDLPDVNDDIDDAMDQDKSDKEAALKEDTEGHGDAAVRTQGSVNGTETEKEASLPSGSEALAPIAENYCCALCRLEFKYEHAFVKHLKQFHTRGTSCVECEKDLHTICRLTTHMQEKHGGGYPLTCRFCGEKFLKEKSYWNHATKHAGKFSCPVCEGKSFSTRAKLTFHIRTTHSIQTFACFVCGDILESKFDLTKHKLDLHGISAKPGRPKKTVTEGQINSELNKAITEIGGVNASPKTSGMDQTKDSPNESQTSSRREQKKVGPTISITPQTIEVPNSDVTLELFADGTILTKDKSGSNFSKINLESLGIDLNTLQGETNIELVIVQTDGTEVKATIQAQIEKSSTDGLLDKDATNKEVETIEGRPFKCSRCPRTFKYEYTYKCHETIHDRAMSFACNICHRVFAKPKNLSTHLKLHKNKSDVESSKGDKIETETKKEWACTICEKVFKSSSKLNRHVGSVHDLKDATDCPYCKKKFASPYGVERHMKRVHFGPFSCTYCKKAWNSHEELLLHIKKDHDLKRHICGICSEGLPTKISYLTHVRRAHGDTVEGLVLLDSLKTYRCLECGTGFEKSSHLLRHEATHTGEKKEVCEVCNARFSLKWKLMDHLRSVHREELKYQCEDCGDQFMTEEQLALHESRYHKKTDSQCTICEQTFEKYKEKVMHDFEEHGKGFQCELCSEVFVSRKGFWRHRSRRHSAELRCDLCNRMFVNEIALEEHKKAKHNDDSQAEDMMDVGDETEDWAETGDSARVEPKKRGRPKKKVFGNTGKVGLVKKQKLSLKNLISGQGKGRLRKYKKSEQKTDDSDKEDMLSFLGDNFNLKQVPSSSMESLKCKSHRCSVCGERFSRESTLKRHMNSHEENENVDEELIENIALDYRCEDCGKMYSTKLGLDYHLKHKHPDPLGEKSENQSYSCADCGKMYGTKIGLDYHLKHKHPDTSQPLGEKSVNRSYSCADCGKMYSSKLGLDYHLKHKHPDTSQPLGEKSENQSKILKDKGNKKTDKSSKQPFIKRFGKRDSSIKKNKNGHYSCTQCLLVFKTYKGILRHNQGWHSKKETLSPSKVSASGRLIKKSLKSQDQIQCEICYKQFSREEFLVKHIVKKHGSSKEKKVKKTESVTIRPTTWCHFCEKVFKNIGSHFYQKHTEHYNDMKSKELPIASPSLSDSRKETVDKLTLRHRNRIKNKVIKGSNNKMKTEDRKVLRKKVLQSKLSSKQTRQSQSTTKIGIEISTTKSGLLICGMCDKLFPDEDSIQAHMDLHKSGPRKTDKTRPEKASVSAVSKRPVRTNQQPVQRPAQTEDMMYCNICNKSFSSKKLLLDHMLNHTSIKRDERHSSVEKQSDVKPKVKEQTQQKTKLKLNSLFKTKRKIAPKNSAKEKLSKMKNRGDTSTKKIKCKHCKRYFNKVHDIQLHVIKVHKVLSAVAKKRYCSQCKILFKTKLKLDEHDELEHYKKCEECGGRFRTLRGLKMHEKKAHAEPFVIEYTGIRQDCLMCLECHLLYKSEFEYKEHLHTHHSLVNTLNAVSMKGEVVAPVIKQEKLDEVFDGQSGADNFVSSSQLEEHRKVNHSDEPNETDVETNDIDNNTCTTETTSVADSNAEVYPVSCVVANVDTSIFDIGKLFTLPVIRLDRIESIKEYTDDSDMSDCPGNEDGTDSQGTSNDISQNTEITTNGAVREGGIPMGDASATVTDDLMEHVDEHTETEVNTGVDGADTRENMADSNIVLSVEIEDVRSIAQVNECGIEKVIDPVSKPVTDPTNNDEKITGVHVNTEISNAVNDAGESEIMEQSDSDHILNEKETVNIEISYPVEDAGDSEIEMEQSESDHILNEIETVNTEISNPVEDAGDNEIEMEQSESDHILNEKETVNIEISNPVEDAGDNEIEMEQTESDHILNEKETVNTEISNPVEDAGDNEIEMEQTESDHILNEKDSLDTISLPLNAGASSHLKVEEKEPIK